jgi:hypothetical protein
MPDSTAFCARAEVLLLQRQQLSQRGIDWAALSYVVVGERRGS